MHKITSIALKGCVPYKTQSEDFFFKQGNFFVVTDGVSRSFQGKYPKPSPARVVAETVATVLGLHLIAGLDILTAFQTANKSAYSLNKVFGFLNTDYLFSDLAGCVASAITVHDNTFKYGFIGDCGVAKLDQHANLIWHTPDEVAPVVRTFKTLIYETVVNERLVRIRRDFRNKPQADHLTYGVITGEKEAMSYVRTGEKIFKKDFRCKICFKEFTPEGLFYHFKHVHDTLSTEDCLESSVSVDITLVRRILEVVLLNVNPESLNDL
jgi:hypothetical protein